MVRPGGRRRTWASSCCNVGLWKSAAVSLSCGKCRSGRSAAAPPVARAPALRPLRHFPHDNDTAADFHTPTLQQLEAQVRRRPLGRTIVDICLDLAVVPGFCTGTFWNELFDIMQCHGGSVANLMRERFRREQALHRQQDRMPTQGWDWSNLRRQMVRQALGFFIGEPPVLPLPLPPPGAPAAAIATGPP